MCCRLAALLLLLACAQRDAAAQPTSGVLVQSITVEGRRAATVDGVGVAAPGQSKAELRVLKEQERLSPGTVIEIPARTVVTLVTTNGTELTLQPGSRTRLNAVSERGESFTQLFGEAWFKVLRALDFFEVTHERFLAAVKGTEFKVLVDDRDIEVAWIEGQIEVTRDVKVLIDGSPQRDAVMLTEEVSSDRRLVSYQRNVDEFLRDFTSYQDIEAYFRDRLVADERAGDPRRLTEGLTNLGTALVTVGKPADAIAYHERSLALHRQLHPDNVHPAIARDYGKLGIAYADAGDSRRAIESFERSLELLQQLYPDGVHADIAITYTNLGVEAGKIGDSRGAIGYFDRSLALLPLLYPDLDEANPQGPAAAGLAANLGNLGSEYGRLKQWRRAIDYFDRSLAIHRRLHPGGVHPDLAVDYVNLGVQYLGLGDLDQAIAHYDRSLAILLGIFPDGVHPFIAVVYKNLASAWRASGDTARADEYAKKEQAITAKLKR